jgi:hypothetical protein
MTMDTKTTHTFQVTVTSDRLEDFAENLADMGVKVDADELMRARFEGEVDFMVVDKYGDYATAWVARFPQSWFKLPGIYVKDFFYCEEAADGDKLQDPDDSDDQQPGDARFICVSPTPVHLFQWHRWGRSSAGPSFRLPLKIKFVQETEGAKDFRYCRTKLTWDESYRWFLIKLP